jgi:thiol-disulfide isomerase/thioredoxin
MTGFLVGAVVVLTALWLLHLLVLLGVVRRLREHESRLANQAPGGSGVITVPLGQRIPDFETRAVDEQPVTSTGLDGPTLVGFFSPGCQPCAELLPRFTAAAAGTRALAVVEPAPVDDAGYRTSLAGAATVVAGEAARAVIEAFGVRGFPTACLVDAGGVITATGTRVVDTAARSARV